MNSATVHFLVHFFKKFCLNLAQLLNKPNREPPVCFTCKSSNAILSQEIVNHASLICQTFLDDLVQIEVKGGLQNSNTDIFISRYFPLHLRKIKFFPCFIPFTRPMGNNKHSGPAVHITNMSDTRKEHSKHEQ